MIYLALSIISSTGIFVIFKLFNKYKVDTLQGIVVNYVTACICGLIHNDKGLNPHEIITSNWFIGVMVLGFLFIAIFNVMALTAQKNGLSVASVASKMSVIIPVIFGLYVYNESLSFQKITGIVLALVAVYLSSLKQKENSVITQALYLPILLFIGSGIIDTSINYFAPDDRIPLFSALIFGVAFVIGTSILVYKNLRFKKKFNIKSLPLGITLGLINYASIYFLLKALRVDGLESSTLFTVNNVAIVAVSTLIGLVIFSEKISTKNWVGISLALVSIVLVTLA
ncbi:MAG: EamA family transporter [Winogradskyella sp.]|uniref:EamA family transporter n=1 Tax=Winogradskyella sp. TaxID=1883156 RepID=UPI0017A92D06|nr:EamA family transporter [Winogradskyella sp.]MBT8245826.1 GRP family sugar transporter [Winogradskyella sp.]NNK22597.1 EamA family transporter [Winogradskyella sp.]